MTTTHAILLPGSTTLERSAKPSEAGPLQAGPSEAGPLHAEAAAQEHSPTLETLVAEHQAHVTRLVCRLLGWSADVDDVVQDVFLSALIALPKFRGESSTATWLTRIALNKCRNHRRRKLLGLGLLERLRKRPEPTPAAPASQPLLDRETAEQVRAAVERLRQRDRELIVLHYLEELPVADIAAALGISRGAVEVRLSRARQRLKTILKSFDINPSPFGRG